jgi:hypothetical protein
VLPRVHGQQSGLAGRKSSGAVQVQQSQQPAYPGRAQAQRKCRVLWRAPAPLPGPRAVQASCCSRPATTGLFWAVVAGVSDIRARSQTHTTGRCTRRAPTTRTLTVRGAQNSAVQPGSICSSAGCETRDRGTAPASCGCRARLGAIGARARAAARWRRHEAQRAPAHKRQVAFAYRMAAAHTASASGVAAAASRSTASWRARFAQSAAGRTPLLEPRTLAGGELGVCTTRGN